MTGQPNRPKRTFEHLEELTVEQLEELLCASVDFLSEDEDEEYIDAIIDMIVKREHENPTGRLPNVDEAWRRFQESFNTAEGEGLSLYPDVEEERPPVQPVETKQAKPKLRWSRLATVAAILLIFSVVVAPPALGYRDIFEMVGHWNESIFSFFAAGREPETTEAPEEVSYDSLEEALEANGVTTPVVPIMPDSYSLILIEVQQFPEMGKIDYTAFYKNESKAISMHIIQREREMSRQFETDESLLEEYEVNGIVHYIFRNNDRLLAAWYVDMLECSLQVELSIDELKTLIDSIYER